MTPGRDEAPSLVRLLRAGPVADVRFAGAILGPFVVEELVARGGMGAVFRARDRRSGKVVALKVLAGAPSEQARRRFLREAELAGKLDHPGIVPVLDSGEHEGLLWTSFAFVAGETLASGMRGRAPRVAARLLERVARAVAHAHARQVVHRDLKPANVLLRGSDGRPLVTDFGIGRDLSLSSSLTRTGATVGTLLYMAPEQVHGEAATPATDVHALGLMLYEGLSGRRAFAHAESATELMLAIERYVPEPPSRLEPRVSPQLDRVCLRALAKDPARRYPHAGALADALREALAPPRPHRVGRAFLGWGGASAGLLLLGVGGLWFLAPPPSVGTPSPTAGPTPTPDPPGPASASSAWQELTLQPGPLEGCDTTVRCDGLYLNDNFGALTTLVLGDRARQSGDYRALLRFELSAIPADAAQVEATLVLSLVGTETLRRPIEVFAQPLVATQGANGQGRSQTPWVEGTGGRDELLDGVAWNGDDPQHRYPHGRSRRPEFTQPAADERSDFDFGPNGVLDRVRLQPGALPEQIEFDVSAALRGWLREPATNYGLRLTHAPEGLPWDDGRVYLASSDHPTAAHWPRLKVRYRGSPPAPRPDPAEALRAARVAAREHIARAQTPGLAPEEALAAAQQAVETAPFWGAPFLIRALLRRQTHPSEAIVDLELAEAALDPVRSVELYTLRATLHFNADRAEMALRDVETALPQRPHDPQLVLLRARALALMGGSDHAVRVLERLEQHLGDATPWQISQRRALILLESGRVAEAESPLRRALELQGASPEPKTLGLLVGFLKDAGRLEEADRTLTQALERFPEDVEVLLAAAHLRVRQGAFSEAMALSQRVLKADPRRLSVVLVVVQALVGMDRRAEALHWLEQALRAQPPQRLRQAFLQERARLRALER